VQGPQGRDRVRRQYSEVGDIDPAGLGEPGAVLSGDEGVRVQEGQTEQRGDERRPATVAG
jgi:hypothetical protein